MISFVLDIRGCAVPLPYRWSNEKAPFNQIKVTARSIRLNAFPAVGQPSCCAGEPSADPPTLYCQCDEADGCLPIDFLLKTDSSRSSTDARQIALQDFQPNSFSSAQSILGY
jgi:hypothetical protein